MSLLDARESRPLEGGASFSLRNRLFRVAWKLGWLVLARWTPPPMARWRCAVLRLFGARVGRGVRVYASATVWHPGNLEVHDHAVLGPGANCYNQGRIVIGAQAVVSQGAHLCTGSHDVGDPHFQLTIRPIVLGARSWVAAEAFVGPGVTVGEGAVLGARAVAFLDLEPWAIYSGNPAVRIKARVLRGS